MHLSDTYKALERIAAHGWYSNVAGTCDLVTWCVQVADGEAEHDDEFDYLGPTAFIKLTQQGYETLHAHLHMRVNLEFANKRMSALADERKVTRERRFEITNVALWLEQGMAEGEILTKLASMRKVRKDVVAS